RISTVSFPTLRVTRSSRTPASPLRTTTGAFRRNNPMLSDSYTRLPARRLANTRMHDGGRPGNRSRRRRGDRRPGAPLGLNRGSPQVVPLGAQGSSPRRPPRPVSHVEAWLLGLGRVPTPSTPGLVGVAGAQHHQVVGGDGPLGEVGRLTAPDTH